LSSDNVAEIDSELRGRNATITLAAGERQAEDIASDLTLTADKARWISWQSKFARQRLAPPGHLVEAPIDAIRKITLCDAGCRARGALEGAGFGLLIGLVAGGIAAATCHPSGELGNLCGYWYLTGAIFGVPLGTLIGAGAGHRTIIEIQPGSR
jgi:hypothetical protein